MNEFQKTQEDTEFQALKEAVPNWKSQPLPPRDSLASDVTVPKYSEAWPMGAVPQTQVSGGGQDLELVPVIIGVQTGGGAFVPMLVNAVGPATSL